jgi:hypothetical protein
MKARSLLFLLASLLFVGLCAAEERIVTIDAQTKYLTAEQNGVLKLYRFSDSTEITLNGKKAGVDQLLPGQTVACKTVGAVSALSITAAGLGRGATASTPLKLHTIIVEMRVDGSDRVLYQDGKLWIEHLAAKKPTDIVVNGIEWSPTWDGDKTEPFTNFVVPVEPLNRGQISVKKLRGRGSIKLEHLATAPVAVKIEDGHPGADDYGFQISL